ncbi:hypothetical protein TrVE_jg6701 [Triparma verrucosa]|uniref:EF-hand domain-containing protein n=1 Tax=Triparma verrucosa TaxID=1606542 RepID=A0A9W7F9U8_9STRA|nr:hypothetical protein TrVE_jg6701 [Triparma verrucosa]
MPIPGPVETLNPSQIRLRCRELSRKENDQPKVKWAVFQEQHRTEERAAMRFEQKQKKVGDFRRGIMNDTVKKVIGKIQRSVDKQMKEKGGTAFSIIRKTFLNWDADASGEMSKSEVCGALRMLKLTVSEKEADELVNYYDLEGDGEMRYQPLVEDITKLAPHFLDHPNTARLQREALQSSDAKRDPNSSGRKKIMPRICELFLKKLQRNLKRIMREKGGTEFSILRTNFLNWDADKSGEIGTEEFRGAMSILGLKISESEARSIVDYYDVEGDGEMKYQPLVEDIIKGTSHFLVHPSTERMATPLDSGVMDLALLEQKKDEDALFSARPRRRPPNAIVEAFKRRLRYKLELTMRAHGGTIYSICREAFLLWDGDCSGELNVEEFSGAIRKMGIQVSEDEARQIVKFYDLEGDGEMRYQELVKDVVDGVPHFMVHPSTTRRAEPQVRLSSRGPPPQAVKRIEEKIKSAAQIASEKSVTRISGEDLFYGTCIRFDRGNTGKLSMSDVGRVLREIRCKIGEVEMKHFIGWYDVEGSDLIIYKDVVRSIYGGGPSGMLTKRGGGGGGGGGGAKKMNFKSDALTARAKRAGVLAEKARIERKIKDIAKKEMMLKKKIDTVRSLRSQR